MCLPWAPPRAALSAGRTAPSHKTCMRHHHHTLQEQKWPFELQQLSWQLSHELALSAKSSPVCFWLDCKHLVGPRLSCVPVWLLWTWLLLCASYKRSHENRESRSIQLLLSWSMRLTSWAERVCSSFPNSSAWSSPTMETWRAPCPLMGQGCVLATTHSFESSSLSFCPLPLTPPLAVWPPYPHLNTST